MRAERITTTSDNYILPKLKRKTSLNKLKPIEIVIIDSIQTLHRLYWVYSGSISQIWEIAAELIKF
jgi:predicted ATP-dependent serine protease